MLTLNEDVLRRGEYLAFDVTSVRIIEEPTYRCQQLDVTVDDWLHGMRWLGAGALEEICLKRCLKCEQRVYEALVIQEFPPGSRLCDETRKGCWLRRDPDDNIPKMKGNQRFKTDLRNSPSILYEIA